MTTPYQQAPDGAVTVGGGTWNYGQTMNESLGRAAFEFPMPTLDNMVELLRLALETLPLEALEPFKGFLGLADNLFASVGDAVEAIISSLVERPIWDILLETVQAIFDWLTESQIGQALAVFAGDTENFIQDVFKGLFTFIGSLISIIGSPTVAGAVQFLQTLVNNIWGLLTGLTVNASKNLNDLYQAFVGWIAEIPTIEDIVSAITGGLATTLAQLTAFFSSTGVFINRIWTELATALGLTGGLQGLVTFFSTLSGNFAELIKDIVEAITGVVNGTLADITEFFSDTGEFLQRVIRKIAHALTGAINGTLDDITEWVAGIPVLGDITTAVTAAIKAVIQAITDIVDGDLSDLATWFTENVLKIDSPLNALNIVGQIPAKLLGLIPVNTLTDQAVNLLTDPTFLTSASVSNTDGWSWDGTQTATGTGGSAKVVCDGYTKQLMNKTHFAVAPGDTMRFSAKIKTASLTGVDRKITLSAVEFHNGALGITRQVAVRTTDSASWVELAGDYTVPAGCTALQFRLGVENANSGSVWFDDLDCHKTGLIKQDLVDNLNTAWENMYGNVYGTSGVGRRWQDAVGAVGAVSSKTNTASATADTAQGNILQTWNKFWESVFGGGATTGKTAEDMATASAAVRSTAATAYTTSNTASAAATTAQTSANTAQTTANTAQTTANTATSTAGTAKTTADNANGNVLSTWLNLYGQYSQTPKIRPVAVPNLPGSIIDSGAVNANFIAPLDGSKITTGSVNINRLPTTDIGTRTNPTSGSGAQISRRNTANVNGNLGRNVFPTSFFDTIDRSGTNIVTTLSQGKFRVTEAGWYMVELSFRLNPTITFGFSVAPLLFKGSDASQVEYKIGNDAIMGTWGFGAIGNRYAQSTWIVYLNANEAVRAGYDGGGTGVDIFDADASGVETYFSISMMNKTFA